MAIETWSTQPNKYDIVTRSSFFNEIKSNLEKVILDYAELGVADETTLINKTRLLFTKEVVPAKEDWVNLNDIINVLIQKKEFRTIWSQLYEDAYQILDFNDLIKIREFLDLIQTMAPLIDVPELIIPEPNITKLRNLNVTISNLTLFNLTWEVDPASLLLKNGIITGKKSINEDIKSYNINITSGTFNKNYTFLPSSTENKVTLPLDWWAWFGRNIKSSKILATYTAIDKRGNIATQLADFNFNQNVKMQTPLKQYVLEYKVNENNWKEIYRGINKNYTFNNISEVTGTYTFRVKGIDELNQETEWLYSKGIFVQYKDYTLTPPIPVLTPGIFSIKATWKQVQNANYYEVWIGNETTAKAEHTSTKTRWKKIQSSEPLVITFNELTHSTNYTVYIRAVNERNKAIGNKSASTLVKSKPVTKTYLPIGNQVWNGGYNQLNWHYSRGYQVPSGWWLGGKGDSTGCFQGEWVDGTWTGIGTVNHAGQKLRGGGGSTYWAYDGQHWGNRMSFIHYDYNQMRKDMKGKTILKVVVTAVRTSSYHGYHQSHPLYLYNHKRDYTTSTSVVTNSTGGSAKTYTVKSGDWLAKIATAYNITVTQLKQWNGLSSNLIHPGQVLKVSQPIGGTATSSDNRLNLYLPDTKAIVNKNNMKVTYGMAINRGNTFEISNEITRQLVNNIVNGDMKGIGMAKWYGDTFSSPAGYYNQDLAYMNFQKGSFKLTVTYE